jgi:hypothetical protein
MVSSLSLFDAKGDLGLKCWFLRFLFLQAIERDLAGKEAGLIAIVGE